MSLEGRKRVLVLDDSALILEIMRVALESVELEVHTAVDLEDLEQTLARERPDLALIDVNMPEAFGDDVAAVLRHVRAISAPIYLFSNLDETDLRRRVEEADVDGFISKRWGIDEIVARVAEILTPAASVEEGRP